ncbi:MAG: hypothetical protein ACYTAN_04015 [Planctomycetota bacterium]|jgi:hypothetical protein
MLHPVAHLIASLLLLVVIWCRPVLRSLPSDIEALRASEDSALKVAIVSYWAITALFIAAALCYARCLIISCL